MKFTYKYLGRRGIRIDGKDYETNDIVKLEKPITEFGFTGYEFEELREMSEREELRIALESFKRKKKEAEEQYIQDLEDLKKEAKRRLNHELAILESKRKMTEKRIKEINKSFEKETKELEKKEKTVTVKKRR